MKKQLIAAAVAAMASTGAFAQVTVGGVLDFAYGNATGSTSVKGSTVSTRDFTSATSVINIIATEDLGGGMAATAKYGLDPRVLANNANQSSADQFSMNRDELFVGLSGGFGNVKLGSPNSIGLTSFLGASLLGTGVGSGYATVTNGTTHAYSQIRYDRSVRYDSPAVNGFTVSALYAPGNDRTPTSTNIPNQRTTTELGLGYENGPLKASYVHIAQDAQTNAVAASAVTVASDKTAVNIVNLSYKIGDTTLVAGWNSGDTKGSAYGLYAAGTVNDTKGWRLGARQDIGNVALIGQYTSQRIGDVDSHVAGVRADYNLSKSSAVYLAYEKFDSGFDAQAVATSSTGNRTITSVGLRKLF